MDYCDSQGEKGACDKKSAAIKFHMKINLNSGNNIENVVLSSGGMSSVRVTSCGPSTATAFLNVKL